MRKIAKRWPSPGDDPKARRIYHYRCANHPARKCRSHYKARADEGLCAACRRNIDRNENQTSLLDRINDSLKPKP